MAPVAFVLALATGVLTVRAVLPGDGLRPRWAVVLLELALGAGLGAGIASALFFVSLAAGISSPFPVFGMEVAACLGLVFWNTRRRPGPAEASPAEPAEALRFRWNWILALVLALGLLVAGSGLIELVQAKAHGEWDAWAIWNLRARFLAGPGDSWRHAVSPLLERTHPYYPLLTSAWNAWVWKTGGTEFPAAVPAATALLFLASTLALAVAFATVTRGATAALACGLILLSSSGFLLQAASQYADVPLAFYYAASVALTLAGGARSLILAGLFAGFAAWTKNEGAAFLVFLLLAQAAVRRNRDWRNLALGALPGVVLTGWFKIFVAPSGDPLFRQGLGELAGKVLDFGRYAEIGKYAVTELARFGSGIIHPLLLLAIAAAAMGWRLRERERPPALAALLALALTFASYLAIYVIVPQDLAWRLETSLGRLYAQLWPAFLLLACMGMGYMPRPEEPVPVAVGAKRPPKRKQARQAEKRR